MNTKQVTLSEEVVVKAEARARALGITLAEYMQGLVNQDTRSKEYDPWLEPVPKEVDERWEDEIAEFDEEEKPTLGRSARTAEEFINLLDEKRLNSLTMKEIKYSLQFTRYYKQRIAKDETLKREFQEAIEAFSVDRTLVRDHALQNVMQGKRAFSINNEYRVIYLERDDYYLFIDIGTHEQVYRR